MKTQFKIGDVVSCTARIKVEEDEVLKKGTVIMIGKDRIYILDSGGYIHECEGHKVYAIQAN